MEVLFEKLNINYILLEEGVNEAIVDAVITQNNKKFNTQLVMDFTDFNRLLLKLNNQNAIVSISENFNCYQTEKGNLYTLDMSEFGWDKINIESFSPLHKIRQIRA